MDEVKPEVLIPGGKLDVPGTVKSKHGLISNFKKLTCILKEEEYLITKPGVPSMGNKRYKYSLVTLQNDMGFGSHTGDMIESVIVYSMDGNRFATGGKYNLEFKEI